MFQLFPLFLFLLKKLSKFCLVFERWRLRWEICQFFRKCLFFNDFNSWFMVRTSWFLWTKISFGILILSIAHHRSVFLMVSCIYWQFLFQFKGLLSFGHLHAHVFFRWRLLRRRRERTGPVYYTDVYKSIFALGNTRTELRAKICCGKPFQRRYTCFSGRLQDHRLLHNLRWKSFNFNSFSHPKWSFWRFLLNFINRVSKEVF